jgi:cytosine/adenosine deaminase-related metal-dependent hydrolase
VTDRDGEEKMQAGIAENIRFRSALDQFPHVSATFGLHASLTLSDDTLKKCVDANPEGEGFHIHVAEHEADENDSLDRYSKRVVNRLNDYGILGSKTIAAHCVHINEDERDLLKATNTSVTHQPRSNMNNAVGAMDWEMMLKKEIQLGLGNDGFSNDMWAEWKAAYLLHKAANRDPRYANGADIARVAIENNARLAETFFPNQRLGELSEGSAADIIFIDYKPFTPMTTDNLPWHILFGFQSSMVTATIVDGVVLMYDRQLRTLDEAAIAEEALYYASGVWARYNEIVQAET